VFIGGGFFEEGGVVLDAVPVVAEDADGNGAGVIVFCVEELAEERFAGLIEAPCDPEGFDEVVFVIGVGFVEACGPFGDGWEDLVERAAAEFPAAAVAGAVFREFEVIEESGDGSAFDLSWLEERAGRVGDAVDAAVDVVAEGVAGIVLHVTDEDIVPVDDVERAVWGEFEVDGAEVAVVGLEEVVAEFGFPAGAFVIDGVLFDAEEADGVAEEDVALNFVREVGGGDEFEA
jgi:hypothetical protein